MTTLKYKLKFSIRGFYDCMLITFFKSINIRIKQGNHNVIADYYYPY